MPVILVCSDRSTRSGARRGNSLCRFSRLPAAQPRSARQPAGQSSLDARGACSQFKWDERRMGRHDSSVRGDFTRRTGPECRKRRPSRDATYADALVVEDRGARPPPLGSTRECPPCQAAGRAEALPDVTRLIVARMRSLLRAFDSRRSRRQLRRRSVWGRGRLLLPAQQRRRPRGPGTTGGEELREGGAHRDERPYSASRPDDGTTACASVTLRKRAVRGARRPSPPGHERLFRAAPASPSPR